MTARTLAFVISSAVALVACRELTIYPALDAGAPDDDCDVEPCESADASTD